MKFESGFSVIFIGAFWLPAAANSVQRRENRGIFEGGDAYIHALYGIEVPDGYCVELAVVYKNWSDLSYSGTNRMRATHSVWDSSTTFIANILCISCFSNSRAHEPAWYVAE